MWIGSDARDGTYATGETDRERPAVNSRLMVPSHDTDPRTDHRDISAGPYYYRGYVPCPATDGSTCAATTWMTNLEVELLRFGWSEVTPSCDAARRGERRAGRNGGVLPR